MMKTTLFIVIAILLFSVLLQACERDQSGQPENPATSPPDTLVLRTQKVKGKDLFGFSGAGLNLSDTAGLFPYPVNYPAGMTEVMASRQAVDFSLEEPDYIDIITGKLGGKDVLVVDQNNNQDFTDDPVREFLAVDWETSTNSILCYYRREQDGKTSLDSSWVKIGLAGADPSYPVYGSDEHIQAEVTLGGTRYLLAAVDRWMSAAFTYSNLSTLAVFAENGEKRDTLPVHDIITTGEYLLLAGEHYRFDSITHDGTQITLSRDPEFASREGTQVGMLAPAFESITIDGDTLRSEEMRNKPTVVANSCGCGGDKASGEAYAAIQQAYGTSIYALRLDSGFDNPPSGWNVDVEEPYNESIYRNYRGEYCSRTAYLVDRRDRRILEKFDVTDWVPALSRHIKP